MYQEIILIDRVISIINPILPPQNNHLWGKRSTMSSPVVPSGASLYGVSVGTVSSSNLNSAIRATRAPATSDVRGPSGNYPIGQLWVDTTAPANYMLSAYTSSNGVVSATWNLLSAGSGDLDTLNADSGSAVPTAGAITIAGTNGVVTSATGSTVTVSLVGGSTAIDSFVPDAGTNPVVPSATGAVTMAGTAAQITTTGGLNTLTFSLPSAVTAPGSLATTTTLTAGTGLTVTSGGAAITGTTTINTSGAAVTTIGTGGTGATNIGNATGNTAVTGSLTASTTLTATLGAITATNGNLVLGTAGNKIISTSVASTTTAGANSFGKVTLVSGTATIATTAITANSIVLLTRDSIGGTGASALGMLSVGTKSAGVSFIINALQTADATAVATTDVSSVSWMIIN